MIRAEMASKKTISSNQESFQQAGSTVVWMEVNANSMRGIAGVDRPWGVAMTGGEVQK